MKELQIFKNNEFGNIRVLNIDNEPWFVGKDVCKIFGDKNHNRSIGRVDEEDKREETIVDSLGRNQKAIFINESGLYSLLFAMQPQKANNDGLQDAYPIEVQERIKKLKKFKRWVTSEVLPSIRKQGYYCTEKYKPKATSVGEVVNLIKMTRQSMKEQGCGPREIAIAVKQICDQFNITLPNCFVKPKETTLNDVYDMIDFIYSQPRGRGIRKPTYEEYIIQSSLKRLERS